MRVMSKSAPRSGRSVALDGLRGYAAAAVVVYHTILACSPGLEAQVLRQGLQAQGSPDLVVLKLVLALVSGEWAVTLFFVISGIVLFRGLGSMHRGTGAGAAAATAWRFLVRRLLRIWPVMAVCLVVQTLGFQLLDLAWPGLVPLHGWSDLALNLSLVSFPIHGATWTLAVELAGAPVLVLAFLAVRRWGLAGLLPFLVFSALTFKDHKLLFNSPGLIIGLPALLAGVVIECGTVDWAARRRAWKWAPAVGLVLVLTALLFVPAALFKTRTMLLFGGVSLFVAWARLLPPGPALNLLQSPVSQYLGRISFSLYLWNVPIFTVLLGLFDPATLRAEPLLYGLGVGVAALAATIPIADVSERWLERGCIRLGRALTGSAPALRVRSGAAVPSTAGSASP
jgi:peptidoglycan/LPS O-acetylase OafA/YrhL